MIDRSRIGFRSATTIARVVHALDTRFTGVALLGDTLHLSATPTGTEDGCGRYELQVRTAGGAEIVTGSARIVARTTAQRAVA